MESPGNNRREFLKVSGVDGRGGIDWGVVVSRWGDRRHEQDSQLQPEDGPIVRWARPGT